MIYHLKTKPKINKQTTKNNFGYQKETISVIMSFWCKEVHESNVLIFTLQHLFFLCIGAVVAYGKMCIVLSRVSVLLGSL